MGNDPETPIEEWRRSKATKAHPQGREYTVLAGPGGGTVFRQGDETPDAARLRRSIELQAKREAQAAGTEPKRPKGKGRKQDAPPSAKTKAAQDAAQATDHVKAGKGKPSKDQLAAAAELPFAVLGAFVGRGVLDCDYCAQAMQANAGAAAKDLAATSNPYIINLLTWWHGLISTVAVGDGLVKYLGPPIVHHALPAPAAEFLSPFMGVPARPPKRPHAHREPGPARAETTGPIPASPGMQPPPPPVPPERPVGGDGMPPQAMTPQEAAATAAAAQQRIQSIEARLAAERDVAARQAAAAGHAHGPNVPSYRAQDTMPTGPYAAMALRQQQAAAEAAAAGGGLPNYSAGPNGEVMP